MEALAKLCPKCSRRYDSAALFCQTDGVRLQLTEEKYDPYIGQTLLDQFKIEEKIGAGGMGSVYRARQTTLHRDVAIKILHPELADNRDAVRRFKREARVCTALDHANVVRVFLFGQLKDGSLYIVMEYLEGRSLLEVLRRDGALPVHRALHIATQVCDGVGEAHAQGVVHRDIKPENVVLVTKKRDSDFVKVLDFGIARVLWGDEVTQATQSGLVFGTARYISPEGAAGEPTDVRSDVYSLGILTYQLLSGVTPFDAPSPVAMLMKHLHADPPHLLSQTRAQHVPEAIADVVMRALTKNPEGRYDDAHDLAEAMRAAAESSGFEVHGRRAMRPSIGPPSESGLGRGRSASAPVVTPTPPMSGPPPQVESPTLEGAPSPFGDGDDEELAIPGLGRIRKKGEQSRLVRTLGTAFLIGAVLVGGGFGVEALLDEPTQEEDDVEALVAQAEAALARGTFDDPRATSVLGLTERILADRPSHPAALRLRGIVRDRLVEQAEERTEGGEREEAIALYRRALRFVGIDAAIDEAIEALNEPEEPPPIPGIRTRPIHIVERHDLTFVAVLADGVEVGERQNPRFVLKRGNRQIGRSVAATLTEDGSYEAAHRIVRPGTYRLIFRIGSGRDRIEESAEIEVHRDPDRPRHRHDDEDDLPPITTQGSSWTPSVAPAWTPTVDPSPIGPQVNPLPQPDPPPPPAPWTGGGSVL